MYYSSSISLLHSSFRIQNWYPKDNYRHRQVVDETKLTEKQIKCFHRGCCFSSLRSLHHSRLSIIIVDELETWWAIFAPKLELAMRANLVRVVFGPRYTPYGKYSEAERNQLEVNDTNEMIKWRATHAPTVPIMLHEIPKELNIVTNLAKRCS